MREQTCIVNPDISRVHARVREWFRLFRARTRVLPAHCVLRVPAAALAIQ